MIGNERVAVRDSVGIERGVPWNAKLVIDVASIEGTHIMVRHPLGSDVGVLVRYEQHLTDMTESAFELYALMLSDGDEQVIRVLQEVIRRGCYHIRVRTATNFEKVLNYLRVMQERDRLCREHNAGRSIYDAPIEYDDRLAKLVSALA